MASRPGILTDWPWQNLGNFKYMIIAPFVAQSIYSFIVTGEDERDLFNFLIFPFLIWRMLHNQIWITLSRHRTAKGNNRIVDKGIDFDQVDRESNWDDQILLSGILYYTTNMILPTASHLPLWRTDGVLMTILLHIGPVEFLYYWFHRALHHHYLYSRYHSHHHSSIVTEPITSVTHPFAEHIVYFLLFAIPLLPMGFMGTGSLAAAFGYVTYIDFMNNMGHCNFEFIPKRLFSIFPFFKYLMYTPSFHSLHHTHFRTNYSLFLPLYDYIYGTVDKSSDTLYQTSLERKEEDADVIHLTHLTTPQAIYHLRFGFASLASKPFTISPTTQYYLWVNSPLTWCSSVVFTWIYSHTFVLERNAFNKLKLQSWVVPRFISQYSLQWQREAINNLIEEAIKEANTKGAKVLTLGLLNQSEELNRYGELYIERQPQLKVKVVDGSSLAAAIVINSIPKETTQVLLRGTISKIAQAITFALCKKGIQVAALNENEYQQLKLRFGDDNIKNLVHTTSSDSKIWLVGDGLTQEEQLKASKKTLFIPYSQFPPKRLRKDCFYYNIPAMIIPKSFENIDSCENWLPRGVMSAWRIAGIVHALEGWSINECGDKVCNIDNVWQATLRHGFIPISTW